MITRNKNSGARTPSFWSDFSTKNDSNKIYKFMEVEN